MKQSLIEITQRIRERSSLTRQTYLQRMEQTMSKNQTAEHLGISKATLYEWRKAEGVE